MALVVFEGLTLCLWLLLICVVGITDGPIGLVVFYEQDVQDRVVELGLITAERIKHINIVTVLALFIPMLTVVPSVVYLVNGATGFWDGFVQMTTIYLIAGLFDRLFIDWYWVGHTNAWVIPGTEDLQPYIPTKTVITKWAGTLVGFPLMAALLAGMATLLGF